MTDKKSWLEEEFERARERQRKNPYLHQSKPPRPRLRLIKGGKADDAR